MSFSPTTLTFHPLSITADGEELIVGRVDTGEFVALPPIGGQIIALLQQGLALDAVAAQLAAETGEEIDLEEFVGTLVELGFVRAIDGVALAAAPPAATADHTTWLRPEQAAWLFSRPALALWGVLVAAGLLTLLRRPELLPSYRDFFWTPVTSLVILTNTLLSIVLILLHEFGHLAAIRSLGLPGRLELGTRLHHLVAQVDVSAVWAAPRARRYRVYLAGMALDTAVVALALLALAYGPLPELAARLTKVGLLLCGLGIVWQLNGYLRTDLYYVLANALRCGNLYGDALTYLRQIGARLLGRSGPDPLAHVPPAERRAVGVYAWVLLIGSAAALAVAAVYRLPIWLFTYLAGYRALVSGLSGGGWLQLADGLVTLGVSLAFDGLFLLTLTRGWRASLRPGNAKVGVPHDTPTSTQPTL